MLQPAAAAATAAGGLSKELPELYHTLDVPPADWTAVLLPPAVPFGMLLGL
jgi:hypothetical protein